MISKLLKLTLLLGVAALVMAVHPVHCHDFAAAGNLIHLQYDQGCPGGYCCDLSHPVFESGVRAPEFGEPLALVVAESKALADSGEVGHLRLAAVKTRPAVAMSLSRLHKLNI